MGDHQDYVALDWVAGEIQETLTQAAQALQAYTVNRDDATKLRFCLTHIHQVHGTLKMVEFFGAALLAEEMEGLAQALTQGTIQENHIDDALSVLNNSLAQLPIYLARVKESRQGLPAKLLPILNDLRAVRGESLLSETVLFAPKMETFVASGTVAALLLEGNELKEVVHKLRQMYQIAFLGLIRGQEFRKNINYLAKVCARLAKLTEGRASSPLWNVCIAVLEGLLNGSIESSVAVKILLRQVDRQIKQILDFGETAIELPPPEHLLKNLLYYIACCKGNSQFIRTIKEEYHLDGSLIGGSELDDVHMEMPDSLAMDAVMEALAQELNDIETELVSAGVNTKHLANVLPLFRRVSDTMAILGMGRTLKPIQDAHSQLAKLLATQDVIQEAEIKELIQCVTSVEIEFAPALIVKDSPSRELFNNSEEAQEQLDSAFDSVIRECRAGLEQTKEATIEFVATQWNYNCLNEAPELLSQIAGSMAMVPLERAARVVVSCENYVSEELLKKRKVPEWQMLDTLADAITSIDYYLERLTDDASIANSEGILDVAEQSVAELGYPVDGYAGKRNDKETPKREQELDAPLLTEELNDAGINTSAPAGIVPFQSPELESTTDLTTPTSNVSFDNEEEGECDPEIIEIFIEEAGEVIETIEQYLPAWIANENDEESRAVVRRAFHTLKGSGRMVNAVDLAELTWSVESMLNRVIDGSFVMDSTRFDVVTQAKNNVSELVLAFKEKRVSGCMDMVDLLIKQADELTKEQHLIENVQDNDAAVLGNSSKFDPAGHTDITGREQQDALAKDVLELNTDEQSSTLHPQDSVTPDGYEFDAELMEIFAAETAAHLETIDNFIAHCKQLAGPAELTDDLQRALHTLKGSANMAGVAPVAMLITPVEYVVKEFKASQVKVDATFIDLFEQASTFIRLGIDQMNTTPMQSLPGVESFIDQLMTLFKERMAQATDENSQEFTVVPQAQNLLLTESLDRIMEINEKLSKWELDGLGENDFSEIEGAINRLIDNAEAVNMIALAEFGQAMSALLTGAANYNNGCADKRFFVLAATGCDALIDMLDQIAGHQNPVYDLQLLMQIQDYEFDSLKSMAAGDALGNDIFEVDNYLEEIDFSETPAIDVTNVVSITETAELDFTVAKDSSFESVSDYFENDDATDIVTEIMTDLAESVQEESVKTEGIAIAPSDSRTAEEESDDEIDAEIREIFLEEADDLLEAIDDAIHKWGDEREGRQYLDDLLRILHTLKGGARLAKMTELGNLSHNFETFLIGAETDSTVVSDTFLSEVQQYQDQLISQLSDVKLGGAEAVSTDSTPSELSVSTASSSKLGGASSNDAGKSTDIVLPIGNYGEKRYSEVVPFVAAKPKEAAANRPAPKVAEITEKKGSQEVVKVSAQLLEQLVNLAGETSISRGQAEEQISELVFSLDEMQITVDRLQEQVRRLDMETEQQILFRQEQVESEGLDGFDPLEMDRYSALQQLSKSLMESSSDLIDIKSTLHEKSRDMETLLIQQSRINTALQEGLMRSRMVPFSRMVPRLRRIVRQVSSELDKKVDFKLYNVEGELDRTVLERMVAPLEHMLRNAIDHGLESSKDRIKAGKPEKGTVKLDLNREGGEIVLTMSDDGAGINLSAVRHKAIERGLMEPDANLTDSEISLFILQSGFSTVSQVTQLSGRGVGMDVVHSEIKQLGGSIEIESVSGQGTQFIVRLPFTVSVNRALMVSVDGDVYAIPLNTIEGIVRVSPFELEAYYQPDAPMFEYAGQPYLLRYMGALLRRGEKPLLEGQSMPLPVVLVRGADHSVAIQVDHLMGSREIVVKPLGPQFSLVQGLTGATVLGDGSVVVILDLLAMIRADASHLHKDFTHSHGADDKNERALLVMVVDDSVTVRKVTSRFLERQGYDVLLAKDGVDAMTQLQELEQIPDIMLLDIEMPRMDGFEVASRVRHSSRLKELPIIMITSRTGEKHRERALSLGVNYYMGKPYQETELLETINNLAGITAE